MEGFKNMVLSREALIELGSVSKNFPEIASISLITSKKLSDVPKPKRKYSDVVKLKLNQDKGDKAQTAFHDKDEDLLHLQKVATASRKPISLIVLKEGDIKSTVDVVPVETKAPLPVGAAGNTCSSSATYWRPWN